MILVFTESENGIYKKTSFELLSLAQKLAQQNNDLVGAISVNANDVSDLKKYGANVIFSVENPQLKNFSAKAYCAVIEQIAKNQNAHTLLLSTSVNAKYIAPMLAVKLEAAYLPNVNFTENQEFKKILFSSKAIGTMEIQSEKKIISLAQNSFPITEKHTDSQVITDFPLELNDDLFSIKIEGTQKNSGKISLTEAPIVVSGGRGLQSPENWHLIENLAESLGAATACTKPVSDMGWRPHSEHVGQTGKPISCDLYIAVGISGAIQHIAGINSSKTKVVINSDPEAPFFKVADYGIVGDAFEIVPKLTQKIKEFKETQK